MSPSIKNLVIVTCFPVHEQLLPRVLVSIVFGVTDAMLFHSKAVYFKFALRGLHVDAASVLVSVVGFLRRSHVDCDMKGRKVVVDSVVTHLKNEEGKRKITEIKKGRTFFDLLICSWYIPASPFLRF